MPRLLGVFLKIPRACRGFPKLGCTARYTNARGREMAANTEWDRQVLGKLWRLREQSKFTYHGWMETAQAESERQPMSAFSVWANLCGVASGLLLGSVATGRLKTFHYAWAGANASFFPVMWLYSAYKEKSAERRGKQWGRLYDDATALRNKALDKRVLSEEQYDAEMHPLVEQWIHLGDELMPDLAARVKVHKDLDARWYKSEADYHAAHGYNRRHVPEHNRGVDPFHNIM